MAKCSKIMFLELDIIVVSLDSISGFLNEFVQYEIRSIYIQISAIINIHVHKVFNMSYW